MTAQPIDYDSALYGDDPDYEVEAPDLPPEEAEAFDLANWHLRQIDRVRRHKETLRANVEAEIARLTVRLETRLAVLDGQEEWHARPLRNMHRAILARDEKRKTIALACGTLKATKQQDEWLYVPLVSDDRGETPENVHAFIEWAQQHRPELVAPRLVGVKVPDAQVAEVVKLLATLGTEGAEPELVLSAEAPDKSAVKATLVKKDEKGKVLVKGVDPDTGERPPGLIVREREPKYEIITDPDV